MKKALIVLLIWLWIVSIIGTLLTSNYRIINKYVTQFKKNYTRFYEGEPIVKTRRRRLETVIEIREKQRKEKLKTLKEINEVVNG